MKLTRLVLIRHGHTRGNCNGLDAPMCGWTDLPLSDEGTRQVNALRDRMRGGPPFDAIYSSPLQRARATAEPLATVGLGRLRLSDALREINCGDVDGLPIGEVQRNHRHLWDANLRQDDPEFRWPGGESYRELRSRVIEFVCSLVAEHRGGTVALVTHAGVINQVVGAIHGTNPAEWGAHRPGNASITEVQWRRDTKLVVRFDDRAHLDC